MRKLHVYLNDECIGTYRKHDDGRVAFQYNDQWRNRSDAYPISQNLPLQSDAHTGDTVDFVFSNLLPDSKNDRSTIAEKKGARSSQTFDLLYCIGRDCIGGLQFVPPDTDERPSTTTVDVNSLDNVNAHLESVQRDENPSGTTHDERTHKSLPGGNAKTSLVKTPDGWADPLHATPSTHILKVQNHNQAKYFRLNETEFFTMKLADAIGLDVPDVDLYQFGSHDRDTALVIERFDRIIPGKTPDDGLVVDPDSNSIRRIHYEDFCQALGRSRENKRPDGDEAGTLMETIFDLTETMAEPRIAQKRLVQHQFFQYFFACEDGHLKNYSLFLGETTNRKLTPFYDISSADPYDASNPEARDTNPNNPERSDGLDRRTTGRTGNEANKVTMPDMMPSVCIPMPGTHKNDLFNGGQPTALITMDDFRTISDISRVTESTIEQMAHAFVQTVPDKINDTIKQYDNVVPDYIYQPIRHAANRRVDRIKQGLAGDTTQTSHGTHEDNDRASTEGVHPGE